MKLNQINQSKHLCALCAQAALIFLGFLGVSCEKPEQEVNWVDLRYLANDEYIISAKDPQVITFQVKSTDPWKVYSYHEKEKWCTIDPTTGDDPEKTYKVEIRYTDNTHLDDRIDTLVIQSDYWIGKWVKVLQKGTAYLNVAESEELLLPREAGTQEYTIRSNQKWSAKITDGEEWCSLKGITSGEGDGKLTLEYKNNSGAMRNATITLYDRYDQPAFTYDFRQDGVQLDIEAPTIRTTFRPKEYSYDVRSNTRWKVYTENPEDKWIVFKETEFENDAKLEFSLTENTTGGHRTGVIVLSTIGEEGAPTVKKTIEVKQSYKPNFTRYEFDETNFPIDATGKGQVGWVVKGNARYVDGNLVAEYSEPYSDRIYKYNNPSGIYRFKILPMEPGARSGLFIKAAVEFRFHLNAETKLTEVSNNKGVPEMPGFKQASFDPNVTNIVEIEYRKGAKVPKQDSNQPDRYYTTISMYLNGELVNTYENVEKDVFWRPNVTLYIGTNKGKVTYDWMEFAESVDNE